jgi:hypothetical protein
MIKIKMDAHNVKDKAIRLEKFQYRATVHLYEGEPIDLGLFPSIRTAQMFLDQYPEDVFCGNDYLGCNKPVL